MRSIEQELKKLADKKRAKASAWFFKTGKGQYGEGDVFLGIRVPILRRVAHEFIDLPLTKLSQLLKSKIHEHRFAALEILAAKYDRAEAAEKQKIFEFYLSTTKRINNWDLVDTSAPYIVGDYLLNNDRNILYKLAVSKNLWEKRIAIVSTAMFIREGEFHDTFAISKLLFKDSHDLIHKAVGWMLREVGKKDEKALKKFLSQHVRHMPRTTLRYAIERFGKEERERYLSSK